MAFLASARRLGQLKGEGFDISGKQDVTNSFFSPGDNVALRKALHGHGFRVDEREDSPVLEARRKEVLSSGNLKGLVEQLCRTADKYAAEYDGWDLTARINQLDEDK